MNRDIFHVHCFFICLVLLAMGVPCSVDPSLLLERSRPGAWGATILTAFWAARLYCQWFLFRRELWRGKRFETAMHWLVTSIWTGLTVLFGLTAALQFGWLE